MSRTLYALGTIFRTESDLVAAMTRAFIEGTDGRGDAAMIMQEWDDDDLLCEMRACEWWKNFQWVEDDDIIDALHDLRAEVEAQQLDEEMQAIEDRLAEDLSEAQLDMLDRALQSARESRHASDTIMDMMRRIESSWADRPQMSLSHVLETMERAAQMSGGVVSIEPDLSMRLEGDDGSTVVVWYDDRSEPDAWGWMMRSCDSEETTETAIDGEHDLLVALGLQAVR